MDDPCNGSRKAPRVENVSPRSYANTNNTNIKPQSCESISSSGSETPTERMDGKSGNAKERLAELVKDTIITHRKIIVVTGGVLSGIGKGVTASSIGVLMRALGLRVTALKIDPYLNVDAGTMSPFEHGEVFVLDDGGECDLDLGNYERFLGVTLSSKSNLTTGKIYQVRNNHIFKKTSFRLSPRLR